MWSGYRCPWCQTILGLAGDFPSRITVLLLHITAGATNVFEDASLACEAELLRLIEYFKDVAVDRVAMRAVGVIIRGWQFEPNKTALPIRSQALSVECNERRRKIIIPADFYATRTAIVLGALYSALVTYSLASLHVSWDALKDSICAAPSEQLARVVRLTIEFTPQEQSYMERFDHFTLPATKIVWQRISGWESNDDPAGSQTVFAVLGYPGDVPALPALQHLILKSEVMLIWEFAFGFINTLIGRMVFDTVAPLQTLHLEGLKLSEWSDAECRMAQKFAKRVSGIRDPDASWRSSAP